MADGKELKPKSFRIDEETAEKFKEIASAIGGNQQEALAKLIESYEFQSGKTILTDKKADIEQFEKYVSAITRMYMGSLEDNQNLTETVRTEFEALLQSKDATIQDLQSQLTAAKQLKEAATEQAKAHSNENAELRRNLETLSAEYAAKTDDMQKMLTDKDNLNQALTDSCQNLKAKVESMQANVAQTTAIRKELSDLLTEKEKMKAASDKLQADFSDFKTRHEEVVADLKKHESDALDRAAEQAQLKQDKAVLKIERTYQAQIEKLKAEKQAEVDKYQQKYFDLLEQLKDQKSSVAE